MSDEIILHRETVARLIEGANHLYLPAFPDEENRDEINQAVALAEEKLNVKI